MAFCLNPEGWGPVSKQRAFDLTPCFEDAGLVGGSLAIIFLSSIYYTYQLRRHEIQPKNVKTRKWLVAKLFVLSLATLVAIAALVLTVNTSTDPLHDESVYIAALRAAVFPAVGLLTRSNHTKTRRSSTIVLAFFPVYIVAQAQWIKTSYESNGYTLTPLAAVISGLIGVAFLANLLECKGPERAEDLEEKENPYVTANFYSRMFFSWMTPLMSTGASRFITEEDMYALDVNDESKNLGDRMQEYWDRQEKKTSGALWRAMYHAYGGPYAFAAFLKVLQDILAFVQPQLLRLLLAYITAYQADKSLTQYQGVALVMAMFVAALAQTAILHQYFYLCFLTGMRIRAGLVTTIYKKALVLSNDAQGSRGDIVNLMSVDATRMQDLTTYGLIFVSGPFQIVLAFISLYKLIGWPSFVGVAIMVVAIPAQGATAQWLKKLQAKQMKIRDQRTKLMSELLSNIKSIKLYSWEDAFIGMVTSVRNAELSTMRRIGIIAAFNTVAWGSIPLLVALATFAVAAYAGPVPLTADIIFPAIALFNLLSFPLAMFAQIVSSIVQATVSVRRLANFLG
ncbi:hypothetical protein FS837_005122, partial [Tulasnella sp. UAMH 9824]